MALLRPFTSSFQTSGLDPSVAFFGFCPFSLGCRSSFKVKPNGNRNGRTLILPGSAALPILLESGATLDAGLLLANEPNNALSLPTWTIHVASVVEWVIAMSLVWRYGGTKGNGAWRGLSWGMVPLLGGALCACTWHFFYNAESLEVLVVLQSCLTLIGNFTLWIAAFRIYRSVQA